ncbi:hypothetical protein NN561_019943 [Cricetulus griseus]
MSLLGALRATLLAYAVGAAVLFRQLLRRLRGGFRPPGKASGSASFAVSLFPLVARVYSGLFRPPCPFTGIPGCPANIRTGEKMRFIRMLRAVKPQCDLPVPEVLPPPFLLRASFLSGTLSCSAADFKAARSSVVVWAFLGRPVHSRDPLVSPRSV